jgi:hypothetical protein
MAGEREALSAALARHLPRFGIQAVVVAALDSAGDVQGKARVVFGFGMQGKLAQVESIKLAELPLHSFMERSGQTQLFMPITGRGQALGAAIMSATAFDGVVLDDLCDLFAMLIQVSAFRG